MEDITLFTSKNGSVTKKDLYEALIKLEANKCRYLYIHSEINFGLPNPDLTKKQLMQHILDTIKALNVENIIVPTYTFSFCNHEDFDIQNTKSSMGVFTEFFRKQPEAVRSHDPLMSVALIGQDKTIINNIGQNSLSNNSTYDLLHKKGETKFLFLGNTISSCFTFSHYVETVLQVPYRYKKSFTGNIIDNGVSTPAEAFLEVRYKDIVPYADNRMDVLFEKQGIKKRTTLGDSEINICNEEQAFDALYKEITEHPDFMLSHKLPQGPYVEDFIYEKKVSL